MAYNHFVKTVLALIVSCTFCAHALADDGQQEIKTSGDVYAGGKNFQKEKAQGWFWKKDPPPPQEDVKQEPLQKEQHDEKQEKEVTQPSPVVPEAPATKNSPAPFSVAWFRENIQQIRDRAIDDPTPENVRAYLLAQRIMLDKASRYKDMAQIISITDPLIDETGRRSTSSFGSLTQSVSAEDNERDVAREIGKKAGLFFFFKGEGCTLCSKQASIMQTFSYMTGIPIIPISIDGHDLPGSPFPTVRIDNGQSKKLQIRNVPAIALAIPPDITRIVSFGPISADQLIKRTVLIAHDAGIVSDERYKSTLPFNDNGYIDSDILKDMPEEYMKNPDQFIKYIQTKAGYAPADADSQEKK
ncbi:type IV conjugative transfer system protein TraF [Klebsiella pneumoniae]|uniref:conjugal transfer protein TraF n=1 Tax=Klebsiella pneumoniae TaxID=573 RepID=UPI0009BABAAA|nr:conjugal transfer protein TraF [Klebsiella pneumoniae]SLP08130.1 type IV conjugative transfer system protein TraF [Klebsiella pneumoniae]SLP11226.1 type IV conjugative transfer system protein TraF [Klebsiella pneumoniae]SLP23578.1 type IV conjugative transfer system protein TraF [Klebsiella pneumoniae]SLP27040.1 type IV conjugative transfer system protein TraF [Klebsiella pneumoniae]